MSEERQVQQPGGDPGEIAEESASLEDQEAQENAGLDDDGGEGEGHEDDAREEDGDGLDAGDADAAPQERQRVGRRSASDRFQQLANENRELRERLDAFSRSQSDAQRQQREQQEIQAEAAREQEVRASMDPALISQYYADRTRRDVQRQVQQIHVDLWNRSDEGDFQRELDSKPRLRAAFESPKIQARYEELRRLYPGVSRLDLLDKANGEAMRKGLAAAASRQQRRSDAELQGRRTAPAGGRGNVAAAPGRRASRAGFEHLRGVPI